MDSHLADFLHLVLRSRPGPVPHARPPVPTGGCTQGKRRTNYVVVEVVALVAVAAVLAALVLVVVVALVVVRWWLQR